MAFAPPGRLQTRHARVEKQPHPEPAPLSVKPVDAAAWSVEHDQPLPERGTVTLERIAAESVAWHQAASAEGQAVLPHPGVHGYRRDGEYHAYNPALVKAFHQAVSAGEPDASVTLRRGRTN